MPNLRRSLFHLLIFAGVAFGLPHLLLLPFAAQKQTPFDSRPIQKLRALRPGVVLVGNSMLQTRIDSKVLSKTIGKRAVVLALGGSASAKWFLSLKNEIIPSQAHPRTVIIFFRDYELTDPLFRTTGQYRESVASMRRGNEPELEAAFERARDWRARFWSELYNHSWVARIHRDTPDSFVYTSVRSRFSPEDRRRLMAVGKSRFEVEDLRDDLAFEPEALGVAPRGDLRPAIDESLLPALVDIAKANGIELIFYRVSRRPGISPLNPEFVRVLEDFAGQKHVQFIEEEKLFGPLPVEWYADGDHIRSEKKAEYSARFGQRLRESLP